MKNFMKKLIGLSIVLGFLAFAGQVQAVGAPVIVSAYASNITQSSASLNGVVNPNGSSSFAWYETPNGGPFGVVNIGSGTNNVNVLPYTLSGLSPNTTYQFRVVSSNVIGITNGNWVSFTTGNPPQQLPTVNLSANPSNVPYGGASTLSWTSGNATSCNATGGVNGWSGPKPLSGNFYTGSLTYDTTFSITCSNSSGSASDSVTVYVDDQVIEYPDPTVNLTANPSNIQYGGSSTISWNSSNANSCYASGGVTGWPGSKPTSGTFYANNLTNTVTFNITCTGNGGSASDSATVYVGQQPIQNPTVNLSANQTNLQYNGSTSLNWYSNNATSCNASGGTNGWAGPKPLSGTFYTGNLQNTTSYSITCSNSSGSASDSVTIYVTQAPPPPPPPPPQYPTVNLTANPSNVSYGGSSSITWTSTNATSCSASGGTSGWAGPKPTSGYFYATNLTHTVVFYITCYNGSLSASDSVTVYVTQAPPPPPPPPQYPTVDLSANPTNIFSGSSTTLSWTSSNATSCVASGGTNNWFGSKNLSGSENTGALFNHTTFTLTCSNNSGSASDSVTVYVNSDDNGDGSKPEVSTDAASNISETSATLNGEVDYWNFDNSNDEGKVRFEYSDDRDDVEDGDGEDTNWEDMDDEDEFDDRISGLDSNTTYYFRAVARNNHGTDYGSIRSFRTDSGGVVLGTCSGALCAPQAITTLATNIGATSARLNGLGIINQSALTTGYFEYGTSFALGLNTQSAIIGSNGSNPYFASLFSLAPNTTYYFRAVVTNQYGTSYGDIRSFRTASGGGGRGIVAGASTVVVQTEVVKEECPCPELVWLSIEANNESLYHGQGVDFLVRYKNVTEENLKDVVIQVMLPRELSFMSTTRGYFSEVNHAIVVDIGSLTPEQEGSFSIDAMVNNDAETGKIIVTAASLVYTTVDDDTQQDVFAYAKNTISENRVNLGGTALFSGSFLPNTLIGWILLLLILLLIFLAAKHLYERSGQRVHITDARGGYGATPIMNHPNPNPPSNLPGAHSAYNNPVNEPPRYY